MKQADLEHRIEMINKIHGTKLAIDWTDHRPRVGLESKPNCINRYISPRITKAQMMFWLDAFEAGLEEAQRLIDHRLGTIICKLCGKAIKPSTAHRHDDGWIGDECCWDERLRTTE